MRRLVVLISILMLGNLFAEEKIPEFDYTFRGNYKAPIQYFTEYYYQPSCHLEHLIFDPVKINKEIEVELYFTLRLACLACKEKYGEDSPLIQTSDLCKYITIISGEQFDEAKPLYISTAISHMSRRLGVVGSKIPNDAAP